MSVCLSECLYVCLFVCLSVCWFVCLSICLSECLNVSHLPSLLSLIPSLPSVISYPIRPLRSWPNQTSFVSNSLTKDASLPSLLLSSQATYIHYLSTTTTTTHELYLLCVWFCTIIIISLTVWPYYIIVNPSPPSLLHPNIVLLTTPS